MVLLTCLGWLFIMLSFIYEFDTDLRPPGKRETWLQNYPDQIDHCVADCLNSQLIQESLAQECHSEHEEGRGKF